MSTQFAFLFCQQYVVWCFTLQVLQKKGATEQSVIFCLKSHINIKSKWYEFKHWMKTLQPIPFQFPLTVRTIAVASTDSSCISVYPNSSDSTCFLITLGGCWNVFNPAVNRLVCSSVSRLEYTAKQQLFFGLLSSGLCGDKTKKYLFSKIFRGSPEVRAYHLKMQEKSHIPDVCHFHLQNPKFGAICTHHVPPTYFTVHKCVPWECVLIMHTEICFNQRNFRDYLIL